MLAHFVSLEELTLTAEHMLCHDSFSLFPAFSPLTFVPQHLRLHSSRLLQSAESESSFRHNENHFDKIPQGNISGSS